MLANVAARRAELQRVEKLEEELMNVYYDLDRFTVVQQGRVAGVVVDGVRAGDGNVDLEAQGGNVVARRQDNRIVYLKMFLGWVLFLIIVVVAYFGSTGWLG